MRRLCLSLVMMFSLTSLAFAQNSNNDFGSSTTNFIKSDVVTLRLLDKVVGRSVDVVVNVGQPVAFRALTIQLEVCFYRPPELPPESAAFLKIGKTSVEGVKLDVPEEIFSGWMFASSPGLNALEHPVYDVWVINCNAAMPEVGTIPAEN